MAAKSVGTYELVWRYKGPRYEVFLVNLLPDRTVTLLFLPCPHIPWFHHRNCTFSILLCTPILSNLWTAGAFYDSHLESCLLVYPQCLNIIFCWLTVTSHRVWYIVNTQWVFSKYMNQKRQYVWKDFVNCKMLFVGEWLSTVIITKSASKLLWTLICCLGLNI